MSCGNSLRRGGNCGKSSGCKCSEENTAFYASQEFALNTLSNMNVNGLTTSDKTIVGSTLENDKLADNKQDHTALLDYMNTKSIGDVNNMILAGSMLP